MIDLINYMKIAFEQSLFAVGISNPNPAVGAVVVKNSIIVGKGCTERPGCAHAEVVALREARENAVGASIFVTLEPCCHFGRTPPCTNAIIKSGIKKVYFAHKDPNPLVRGKSKKILEEAGIQVFEGLDACKKSFAQDEDVLEAELLYKKIERFFEAYDYFVNNKKTFVEIKSAISPSRFMGLKGEFINAPLKITGDAANIYNHELRAMSNGILVGKGTVLADNPSLDVRFSCGNNPIKLIWANSYTFSENEILNYKILNDKNTIVFSKVNQISALKCEVVLLNGNNFKECWEEMLKFLYNRGMHRLMVEPGAKLASQIFESGLWNRLNLWQSVDISIEDSLQNSEALSYPQLPQNIIATESYMTSSDVLTIYKNLI